MYPLVSTCRRQHASCLSSVAGYKGIQVDRNINELCRRDTVCKYSGQASYIRRHVSVDIICIRIQLARPGYNVFSGDMYPCVNAAQETLSVFSNVTCTYAYSPVIRYHVLVTCRELFVSIICRRSPLVNSTVKTTLNALATH